MAGEHSALLPAPEAVHWWHPSRRFFRFAVLFFVSVANTGTYFQMAMPGAVESWVLPRFQITNAQFGVFLSIQAYFSVPLSLVLGSLSDRIGFARTFMLEAIFAVLGSIMQVLAVFFANFPLLLIGRAIFGVACDTLSATQTAIVSQWFLNKELTMAMGLTLAFCRIGLVVAFSSSASLASSYGVVYTFCVGTIFCVSSVVCAIIYMNLEAYARSLRSMSHIPFAGQGEKWRLRDLLSFNRLFWIGTTTATLYYAAMVPFLGVAARFLELKYHISPTEAGTFTAIPNYLSLVTSALMGLPIDRFGHRGIIVSIGATLAVPAFFLFAFSNVTPYLPIILAGIGFSLVPDAIWSAVSLVVPQHLLGAGMGITVATFNFAIIIVNPIVGYLVDVQHNYQAMFIIFSVLSVSAAVFSYVWNVLDYRDGKIVNAKSKMFETPTHDSPRGPYPAAPGAAGAGTGDASSAAPPVMVYKGLRSRTVPSNYQTLPSYEPPL